MKLLTRRSLILVIFILVFFLSLIGFSIDYVNKASTWAMEPYNKHIYKDGILIANVEISDRNGDILFQTVDNVASYNKNSNIRKATMHAVGDSFGNVATSAQVAFSHELVGWSLLQGVYRHGFSPTPRLSLNIDGDLCRLAYQALNGRKGGVGVYNYKTGEVLCMVSSPTFDPENIPHIEKNPEKYEGVYINRLLSASYTPGSIFKLVTAAAAIDNIKDIDNRVFECSGKLETDGGLVSCPHSHGEINFKEALAKSCNVAFGQISLELGPDILQGYAEKVGFNSSIKVDRIKTVPGKINLDQAEGWDLAWAGIGQYTDTANPMTFLTFMGAVANQGKRVDPKILNQNKLKSGLAGSFRGQKRIMSKTTANKLKEMMRYNVTDGYGDKKFKELKLCAKTGTAQVGEKERPHAWFAGFMDREDCPLAFIVIVENGGAGIETAAPIANEVLQAALMKSCKQP